VIYYISLFDRDVHGFLNQSAERDELAAALDAADEEHKLNAEEHLEE